MQRIFVNGTFDILHVGHIHLLQAAKALGGLVLVAVDADSRVAELKGRGRPINSITDRLVMLKALKYVDEVTSFASDEGLVNIIKIFAPDIMVKGSDYRGKPIIGSEFCKQIVYIEKTNDSSTGKIESIVARRLVL